MHSTSRLSRRTYSRSYPKSLGNKQSCEMQPRRSARWAWANSSPSYLSLSLSGVAINAIHICGTRVIKADAIGFHPSGLHKIFDSIAKPSSATYVREPLASGRDRINILLNNIRNTTDPTSSTFEDITATWYHDLLLRGHCANDPTGVNNGILAAFGVRFQLSSIWLTNLFHWTYTTRLHQLTTPWLLQCTQLAINKQQAQWMWKAKIFKSLSNV